MSGAQSPTRIAQYAAEVAAAHDVTSKDVMGTGRTVAVVRARWALWKCLFDEGFTLNAISRAVGRHHTTIMHPLRKDKAQTK